jgi:hypothetical protein
MKKSKIETPILYMVFNRLDKTKKSFEAIKKARPKKLFVAADGPRTKEEKKKTDAVRKYILDNIDWECDLKTLFRDKNLESNKVCCNPALTGAFKWFFSQVEEGVILEDDCIPDKSFLRFCGEMLDKYRDDKRVGFIAGFTNIEVDIEDSYYFSDDGFTWGWAIWKDRFEKYYTDEARPGLKKLRIGKNLFEKMFHHQSILFSFEKIGGWDCRIQYTRQMFGDVIIVPRTSLIQNIGWGETATHTIEYDGRERVKVLDVTFPLKHPKKFRISNYNYTPESRWFYLRRAVHLFLRRYYYYIFGK